ncbi:glycosyltransferase family 4 protein [Maribacter arcticus]|uniref:GalNAc-alpha-(1->4)-GalNAc-alpha-(1->3)-diNAcBac-PP-undecaprenol alpha-1,4-N-acetyl-D-galactosaminyltransferase n=1 Tax=Maribacter arcticus TaxID=561365 RepID=A0A1T5BHY4_9FLAO|nr:glycosyltransferase family 4 protein [Maribacter arcticus]SKB46433.1 GalNAc-alpha-(1->4)-GalNAc-alpha-(1->3)-diNAcBac-PP-undecaprenol alpha-1,4-N-acetyl-D-galactosaminyltransferase [Maribacter arcticus]
MSKKNIAFVIYSLNSGGAERVVSTLANGLTKYYNVTIITFTDIPPFYELDEKVNVVYCFSNLQPSKNFIDSISTNYNLFKQLKVKSKALSIDLLIGFMTNTNILTVLAAKSLKIPVLISERINPKFSILPKLWSIMRRLTYPSANYLIIQTEPIKHYFEAFVKKDKLKILPNPISSVHREFKEKINLPIKENIVLSVGRLSNQKGHDIAIKAFTKLKPNNWELHIVGEGPKRKEYEELIIKLKMTDKIKLIGRDNNISNYYLKSKIFIFPSRFEGFPNALTEAMYMGLPSISTDCPTGPSELIDNDKNGYLIPVDDVENLTANLEILINNKSLRTKLGDNAALSVTHLEEDKVVEQWLKLISESLN